MILKQVIQLPLYDWEVTIYYSMKYTKPIVKSLLQTGCRGGILEDAQDFLDNDGINTGFIYSNHINRKSVIVIGKADSIGQFINTVEHEKNHLEMHICDEFNINPHSEEAAELSGNLAKCLFSSLIEEILKYYTSFNN